MGAYKEKTNDALKNCLQCPNPNNVCQSTCFRVIRAQVVNCVLVGLEV